MEVTDLAYISNTQLGEIIDAAIARNEATYLKPADVVSGNIGQTADGSGYIITLPWFRIAGGLIVEYGEKTFAVPQLFTKNTDGGITLKEE